MDGQTGHHYSSPGVVTTGNSVAKASCRLCVEKMQGSTWPYWIGATTNCTRHDVHMFIDRDYHAGKTQMSQHKERCALTETNNSGSAFGGQPRQIQMAEQLLL